jgi:hypothetical protein
VIALIPISPGALLALAGLAAFVLFATLVYRTVAAHDARVAGTCSRYDKITREGRR